MTLVGTVLITGPTGGLGTVLALQLAKRGASERPDLLLVGRGGSAAYRDHRRRPRGWDDGGGGSLRPGEPRGCPGRSSSTSRRNLMTSQTSALATPRPPYYRLLAISPFANILLLLVCGNNRRRVPGVHGSGSGGGDEALPDRGRGDADGCRRGHGDRAAVPVVAGRGKVRWLADPRAAAAALRRLRGHRPTARAPWLTDSWRGSTTRRSRR